LIDELHHKTALFLVTNFDVLLLPTFETSQMVCKGARKLRRKSVRNMLTFAHYRFNPRSRSLCDPFPRNGVAARDEGSRPSGL
jgi:hypothetical protein